MKSVMIVCPKQNLIFGDSARAMCLSFQELGWSSVQVENEKEIRAGSDSDLVVVVTPLDYPNIRQWLPKSRLVLYQTEILPWVKSYNSPVKRSLFRKWGDLKQVIANYDIIWDYERINIEHNLVKVFPDKQFGFLPFGYSPIFELNEPVTINNTVLFVGNLSKRRTRIMRFLYGKKCGIIRSVHNVYGKNVLKLMRSSAINLNLHTFDVSTFESHRIIQQLFSNRCFVMSELCPTTMEFDNEIHWASASYGFMPSMIKYYLARPERMQEIAENAYNYVKKHYTVTQMLERALGETGVSNG